MAPSLLLPLLLAAPRTDAFSARLQALERRSGGRLGVSALDTGRGRSLEHRPRERFPMCSTFKVLLAGAVLARVDAGELRLDERIPYGASDLLAHAPVTRPRVAEGSMPVEDLCAATLQQSDNTAANLLLDRLGGPQALTAWMRRIGDVTSRLDRREPELNEARPGDPRDTTTPGALRRDLQVLLTGEVLSRDAQARLCAWMEGCQTGARRLRAGLPSSWRVADKTGSGERGTSNHVAMLTPPGRPPLFVAAYLTGARVDAAGRDAVLAEVARLVVAWSYRR